jgi:putative ABC transport system permease protein
LRDLLATRHARVQEAVFFTILGARRSFVLAVFAAESLAIGCASAAGALVLSQTAAWIVCSRSLDIPYAPFLLDSLVMAGVAVLVVIVVGFGATLPVLSKRPATYLREQAEE